MGAVQIRVEHRGSVAAGAALALAGAGLLRVDGALMALGLSAGLWLALAYVLTWWNARCLEVEVEGPAVVRAGEPFRVRLLVANGRRRTAAVGWSLELRTPGEGRVSREVAWIPPGSSAGGDARMSAGTRGAGDWIEYELVSVFPWGLWRVVRSGRVWRPMCVLPRVRVPAELAMLGTDEEADDAMAGGARERIGTPRGLREFRAGDRARSVAWAASLRSRAQGGGLVVRDWDPPGIRPRVWTALFHSYGADGELIRPDCFERALSLAWGALGFLQSRGMEVVWRADFEAWVPRRIRTRADLGRLGEALAKANRAVGTERHELEARIDEAVGEVLVFSDMSAGLWLRNDGRCRVIEPGGERRARA